jgi:hypothetical protein
MGRGEVLMAVWRITAIAEGVATLELEAASEDEAREIAYREHLGGIDIGCGIANWEIEDVEEVA